MTNPLASQALLLASDSRQTVLAHSGHTGLSRQSYSAYGYQHNPAASRTGFNGQLREPQGWYHLGNGHRLYNPALMRFHSQDSLSPFGEGGLNGYAYCFGDPINYTDPNGKMPDWLFHWAIPTAALVLSGGLLLANILTAVVAPHTLVGLTLGSARLSVMGSTFGMVGATTQLASPPGSTARTVGSLVSLSGTVLSIGGALTRAGIQILKLWREPGSSLDRVGHALGVLFKGQRKAPVTTQISRSASASSSRAGGGSISSSSNYETASEGPGRVPSVGSSVRSGSESSYRSASDYPHEGAGSVKP